MHSSSIGTTYSIFIVSPQNYPHSAAFVEIAEGLKEGFAELGYVVPIVLDHRRIEGRCIVLGTNLLPTQPEIQIPPDSIIFNLEQHQTGWFVDAYINLLRTHEVWDYSTENIEWLKAEGIEAKLCGIGYEPCLTRIQPREEDIDVLFYGSIFGRRDIILAGIEQTGLKVQRLFGVYGTARDDWIARSKIVLNIHAYENSPLELVRLSYLWANQRFVISEGLQTDDASELPDLCVEYAQNKAARELVARRSFEQFSKTRQSDYLKSLVLDNFSESMMRCCFCLSSNSTRNPTSLARMEINDSNIS